MIGKYPPIEGGVSTHQYWCAHGLAALGHEVHVITNAREVEHEFRMLMRPEDWARCEADFPGGGSVRVHWTDEADRRQRHIPWHNPFVTKLASVASQAILEHGLEIVFSYYLEPYGVAGHLAAQMTRRPHVVKHAGSDVAHLRMHPQMGPLYDHVLREAQRVVTGGAMVEQLKAAGVDEDRTFQGDDFRIPESLFQDSGGTLDLQQVLKEASNDPDLSSLLRDPYLLPPYLGVYGKLGEAKGTFDLLRAIGLLRDRGHRVSLIVVGHGFPQTNAQFAQTVDDLGLHDQILQLPFLPNWRIPDFIRLCGAVCFLERDFPITIHAPTVAREVLACGKCLIASAEILRRQLFAERLIHGFNCLAVRDVRNAEELASAIVTALECPAKAQQIGRRGRQFSVEAERGRAFPGNFERLFSETIQASSGSARDNTAGQDAVHAGFAWTKQIIQSLPEDKRAEVLGCAAQSGSGAVWALNTYGKLLELVQQRALEGGVLVEAVRVDLAASGALNGETAIPSDEESGLFRLPDNGIDVERDLLSLYPKVTPGLRIDTYHYDVGELLNARVQAILPVWVPRRLSYAAILPALEGASNRVIALSAPMGRLLSFCDGSRTVAETISDVLASDPSVAPVRDRIPDAILDCFRMGLIRLSTKCEVSVTGEPESSMPVRGATSD